MIGLIGAMTVEMELVKERMTERKEETISGITFVQGKLEDVDCVAAVSGIGKVNSAMCAQTMILRYQPRLVINTGVAGGTGKGIKIGDVVVAEHVVQHDMDTSALGGPKGFISGIDMIRIPCDNVLNERSAWRPKGWQGLYATGALSLPATSLWAQGGKAEPADGGIWRGGLRNGGRQHRPGVLY